MTREQELESELRFYRNLFDDCRRLRAAAIAVEAAPSNTEDAEATWEALWDAIDDIGEYVRMVEHADAMDAAGVTCNELHHAHVTPSA